MLKACWDCITGELRNRQNNEDSYSMKVNGDTHRAPPWPRARFEKEKMFLFPKPLNIGDKIDISGYMTDYHKTLSLSLITGDMSPDYQNVAFQFDAIFPSNDRDEDKCTIKIIQDGYAEIVSTDDFTATEIFGNSTFNFVLQVMQTNGYTVLNIFNSDAILSEVVLKHNVNSIRFLSLTGDIAKVNKMCFEFA